MTFSAQGQNKEGNFHLDQEYKISPTGTIKLNSSDGKVYITGSKRNIAHVKIDREVITKGLTFGHEEFSVDVAENNGDIEIRERSNHVSVGMIGYRSEKYTIRIEAPEGMSLLVKGDDGDYWIRNINGAISLDVDDGDIELAQCSGNKFDFRLDDGEITMDEGNGSLDIDADDADVEIKNATFTTVHANVDDGDLIIETSLADDGTYFIDAQDGLVSLAITKGGGKFDVRHDDARVITEGDFNIIEDTENRTRLTLATGEANVDIRADDARVRLVKR
jgi:Putative adhesin